MNGPTGINQLVQFKRMERMDLTPEEFDELDADIRLMESAALTEIHRKKD